MSIDWVGTRPNVQSSSKTKIEVDYIGAASVGEATEEGNDGVRNSGFNAGKVDGRLVFKPSGSDHGLLLSSSWTLSAWIKTPFSDVEEGWRVLYETSSGEYLAAFSNTNYQLGFYSVNSCQQQGFFSAGFDLRTLSDEWHNLVVVGTSGNVYYYVDGGIIGSVPCRVFEPTRGIECEKQMAGMSENKCSFVCI